MVRYSQYEHVDMKKKPLIIFAKLNSLRISTINIVRVNNRYFALHMNTLENWVAKSNTN